MNTHVRPPAEPQEAALSGMSNVIAFARPDARRPFADRSAPPAAPAAPATTTARNHRFRQTRREAWRAADHLRAYWRARLDWHSALLMAQGHGVEDARGFAPANEESRMVLVERWREFLGNQLLTPAPDLAAITWKRGQLRAGHYQHVDGLSRERIERAIEADAAWLAAHPSKRSVAATRQNEVAR
jgi:hypothetical protein